MRESLLNWKVGYDSNNVITLNGLSFADDNECIFIIAPMAMQFVAQFTKHDYYLWKTGNDLAELISECSDAWHYERMAAVAETLMRRRTESGITECTDYGLRNNVKARVKVHTNFAEKEMNAAKPKTINELTTIIVNSYCLLCDAAWHDEIRILVRIIIKDLYASSESLCGYIKRDID